MNDLQTLRELFDQLIGGMNPTGRLSAHQRLEQLVQGRPESIEPLTRVLNAEVGQTFFDESHKVETADEKSLFNYDLASLTCEVLEAAFPKYDFPQQNGILGDYEPAVVSDAVDAMNEEGYYVFPTRLPEDSIGSITSALEQVPFQVRTTGQVLENVNSVNVHDATGNTVWVVDQQDVLSIDPVQSLVMDPMLLNIIQQYLQCIPIHVQTNCWWTINRESTDASMNRDAQKFHQDKAFIRFVKVFIYLNDVTDENGPHTYVAGSARDYEDHVPPGYQFSHRIDDHDLQKEYSPDRFKKMKGPAGTIVLEDTSGFHKGQPVIKGHRLMLQLVYCCSMYFNPVPGFAKLGLNKELLSFADRYPRMFMNYNDARYLARQKDRQLGLAKQQHDATNTRKRGLFARVRKLLAG